MKQGFMAVCISLGFAVALVAQPVATERRETVQVAESTSGMVVSDTPLASQIGAAVLADGGNAVDAAIATSFALAVTWPEAGNLGGGGFMLIASPDGSHPVCIDYRETAPAAATEGMYTPGENRHHARHVGVPGTVAGLFLAHEKYGRLPWSRLVQPSVELARDGFAVDVYLAGSINRVLGRLGGDDPAQVAELKRLYGKPDGTAWQAGDTLTLPDLADTLQAIAEGGAEALYFGELAERFEAGMKQYDGLITAADLGAYRAVERPATQARFRGHDVYGAPPPSSGGVTVGLILQMLEGFDLGEHERLGSRNLHLMAEAMRRAFHQRALHLGDADFVEVDIDGMLKPAYAEALASGIDPQRATPSEDLEPRIPLAGESPDTTHFSVIDAEGLAVSTTTTLEASWGARVVLPGLGFVLNNEMGDFNWVPGRTTRTGAIGTPANVIAPGKRMLSSMSPTIVMRDGKPVLITGSPGGRTIINTVAGIVLNVVEFEMSPADAVQSPRIHHQWFPDVLRIETHDAEFDAEAVAEDLGAQGHTVELRTTYQGSAHTIAVDPDGGFIGVADFRRGGLAAAPAE